MSLPFYIQRLEEMPVIDHINLVAGRGRFRRRLYDLWLRIKCRLTGGHRIVKRRWQRKGDFKDGEWHVGCTRCPLFWVYP